MAVDKLHIICGNCGHDTTNDNFRWEYRPKEDYGNGDFNPADVYISCKNCGTLHTLGKYMTENGVSEMIEDLNNRTCRYCKSYLAEMFHCQKHDVMAESHNTCENFEPKKLTVVDRIRKMSDEDLAELFVYFDCDACDDNGIGYPWCSTLFADGGHFETEEKAYEATLKELKKEVKNEQ